MGVSVFPYLEPCGTIHLLESGLWDIHPRFDTQVEHAMDWAKCGVPVSNVLTMRPYQCMPVESHGQLSGT
jgi:hypothetical protein